MATTYALAELYRRFGETEPADGSALYARIATAVSRSAAALRAIEAAPARRRRPAVVLAVLHDLALSGHAPALADAYATADGDAAAAAAIDTLVRLDDSVLAAAARRTIRSGETGHCAVLYPAIAEAARRTGAARVGLIDVGRSAGLDLNVDRVNVSYSNGQTLGVLSSPVQMTASIVGDKGVPATPIPEVVSRIKVDEDPIDVTDEGDTRWLRACLPPDQADSAARLDAEIALAAETPPLLVRGDAVDVLSAAIARVPADAVPVVMTAWALSQLSVEGRLRFLQSLDGAATARSVAWVSVEGVGVAPSIPTFGDRHASGHSIIGLAIVEHSCLRSEAVGRCWSKGRVLAWLARHEDASDAAGL